MGNRPGSIIDKLKHRITGKRLLSSSSFSIAESTYLETFLLVWLDPHVDTSKENIHTQRRLREILTCLITFDKVETCELWLKKCCSDEKIILIVSGAYGEEILPKIHHLQTIITIYVYCLDVDRNLIWANNFSKIRSVKSSTDELLQELSQNQTNLESVEDSKALKVYQHDQQISSLNTKTASFISYQLLLEILISPDYIPSKGTFSELIQILRQYSFDDDYGSKLIDEFEQTYEPKRAVSWLTRDTPLSRFVNKVLREQDINMLFALRFLLIDIHTQLIDHQAQSLNVFKIQLMLKSEMEHLKANPGQLLVINGFLFASTSMPQLMSTITDNDQFETVLFDIEADFHQDAAPFAFLRNIDLNIEQQIAREVLFMCGSIFEVGPLMYENSIWKLQLKLVGQSDSSILFNMKEKLKENQNLCIIGDLLNQCDQADKATIYYQKLLNELPKRHNLVSHINKQLTKNSSKSNLTSTYNISYVLVNLSKHMTKFSSAVLHILCSLTSKLIFIIDNEPTVDFSQWPKSPTSIFTTTQFASSFEHFPKDFKLFLLDNATNNIDQQRFATIDDLICQLADEIIQKYRLQATEYLNLGDSIKAREQDKYANRIYHELRKLQAISTINNSPMKTSDNLTAPILIWLIANTENDEEDTKFIEKNFGDYFSSYLTFYNESDFHVHLLEEENLNDIFLIIHSDYRKSIVTGSRQFSNVKYVCRYGESQTTDDKIITNQNDLGYRLTWDLIDYYGKLGEQYRTNKQAKIARNMFSKAQSLCHFLSKNFFLSE